MKDLESAGAAVGRTIAKTPDILLCIVDCVYEQHLERNASRAVVAAVDKGPRICGNTGEIKSDFHCCEITAQISRSIPVGPGTRRGFEIGHSIASGTDGFVYYPLFIETAGTSVHMVSHRSLVLTKKTSVQLTGGISFHHKKIKITPVGFTLDSIRSNRQSGCSGVMIYSRTAAFRFNSSTPSGHVHILTAVDEKSRRRNIGINGTLAKDGRIDICRNIGFQFCDKLFPVGLTECCVDYRPGAGCCSHDIGVSEVVELYAVQDFGAG